MPARPPLAFRVGVTGTRRLGPGENGRVVASVQAVLDLIMSTISHNAETTAAADADPAQGRSLRIVSPLAEGADRIVAREALARGFALDVPMPFAQADYEATFDQDAPGGLAEFRDLLARADEVFVIDGDLADDTGRPDSYTVLGRMVVHNCDLMIAIWDDGQLPKGPGGTRDTLHYALRVGVPVWWIHAGQDRRPVLLRNTIDLSKSLNAGGADPAAQLRAYIDAALRLARSCQNVGRQTSRR